MSWTNSLEPKFGRFAIRGLLNYIAAMCLVTFLIYKTINPHIFEILELDPDLVLQGQVWRLVTYLFIPTIYSLLPFPDWWNAFFYTIFLVWIGNGLEHAWGAFRLNLYCFLCAAGITVAAFFFGTPFSHYMFAQAVFFAFARIYPDMQISLYYILPVKVKWLAWFDAAWIVWRFTFYGASYRMAVLAALACYLLFFGRDIWDEARHRQTVLTRRRRFESDVRPDAAETLHRCVICGRTEVVAPDLDFRVARDGQEYCVEHLPKSPAAGAAA